MTPDPNDRADRFSWSPGDVTWTKRRRGRPAVPLGTVRRSRGLTQAQLAELLHVEQSRISRLETQDDARLSSVLGYLRGLGATELELTVAFNDGDRVKLPVTLPRSA